MASPGTEEPSDSTNPRTVDLAIESLRREIETLRAAVAKPDKPWYRDGALLVAIAAFVFTVSTAMRQDVNDTQVELRNVLKEIYSLPAANAEALSKFGNSPVGLMVSQGLNSQNQVLSRQAFELALHLGRNLETPERVAVANAIVATTPILAEMLLSGAKIPPDDIEDSLGAGRILGTLQIVSGRFNEGDAAFRAAEEVFSGAPMKVDDRYVAMSNGATEERWAGAYVQAGNCIKARPHLLSSQALLNQQTPEVQQMFSPQLKQDLANYERACGKLQ